MVGAVGGKGGLRTACARWPRSSAPCQVATRTSATCCGRAKAPSRWRPRFTLTATVARCPRTFRPTGRRQAAHQAAWPPQWRRPLSRRCAGQTQRRRTRRPPHPATTNPSRRCVSL
eukprot:6850213-Pyramimonas_sp.AAC.1